MKNNSTKCLYCCCLTDPWIDVVDRLKLEMNIEPTYFISLQNIIDPLMQKYDNCHFQDLMDAWNGLGFPDIEYSYSLDEELIKNIAFEELLAIKMMDRIDLKRNGFLFSDRQNYFYYLLKRWLVILDYYEINLIISPSIPHRVFDYVLYVAAKIANIEFLMFQMTPFGDSSFIINNIDSTTKQLKNFISSQQCEEMELREDMQGRINQVGQNYNDAVPDYMINQKKMLADDSLAKKLPYYAKKIIKNPLKLLKLFEENRYRYTGRDTMPYGKKEKLYEVLFNKYKNRSYLKRLSKEYNRLIDTNTTLDKYVLVALQYQPEETSIPTGGAYANQELCIEVLNDFLDDDITILIKEHKTQFHPDYEGALGRSINFYNNILSISDRIRFVSVEENPFKLIDKALATVTISGTIGWESVIRGTPAIIFGRAWYEDMVGVFKVKTKEDLGKSWKKIVKCKNSISKDSILDFHKKIQPFLIEAAHDMPFVEKSTSNTSESAKNIYNGIEKYIKNNPIKNEFYDLSEQKRGENVNQESPNNIKE